MESQEILQLGIGTKDMSTLKPAKVKIVSITIKDKTKEDKEMQTPLAEIHCKHPDKDELIVLSKVKLLRDDHVTVVSTWVSTSKEDDKTVINKSSALAYLMKFLNVESLEGLYGKEIDTVQQSDSSSYLCLKAY